jgi:Fe-S cluster assembly scaffold IscU
MAETQYSDKVLNLLENPPNVGSLDKELPNVGTGRVGSPVCGDVMIFQIMLDEDDKIVDAKFKTFGCAAAIASASLATTKIIGKTIEEALKVRNMDIAKELQLPPIKVHCSVLAEDAIRKAVEDYRSKQSSPAENVKPCRS